MPPAPECGKYFQIKIPVKEGLIKNPVGWMAEFLSQDRPAVKPQGADFRVRFKGASKRI